MYPKQNAARDLRTASRVDFANSYLTRSLPRAVLNRSSVPNSHAKAAAVVVVIVIVDEEYQATIDGDRRTQLTTDQICRAQLAVRHPNVSDERSHTGTGQWSGIHHSTEAGAGLAVRSDLTYAGACGDDAGRSDIDWVASPHIDPSVNPARRARNING